MLPVLDVEHGRRLRELLARFRAQEASLRSALDLAQTLADHWHGEASRARLAGGDASDAIRLGDGLRLEVDALSLELAHVRMAVLGVGDELARQVAAPMPTVGTWLLPA
jgi:hypothetical protein